MFAQPPCLLVPGVWGCSLLPGSALKSHFTLPSFASADPVSQLVTHSHFQVGSISSVPHNSVQYFSLQNFILFSSHCQAHFGFLLCSPRASSTWIGTWHFNKNVLINILGGFRAFPSHFPVVSPTQLPAHPTVTPLSGGLSPAALCGSVCGSSRVLLVRSGMRMRSMALKQSLSWSLQDQAVTLEVWDSFPGSASAAEPVPLCSAEPCGRVQAGGEGEGSAVLLALAPSAHWGTWHQPTPSQCLLLAGPSAAPMDAPSLSKIMAWAWRNSRYFKKKL